MSPGTFSRMRFPKNLALLISIAVVRPGLAEDRATAPSPDPSPSFLTAPAKPSGPEADGKPPLGEPVPPPAQPPSLLPDEIPAPAAARPAPSRPAPSGRPRASLRPQATAAEFDLRIRYRKARNLAEANEKVRTAWDVSRLARTDLQKRETLKRYYDVLFAQMLAADHGIAPLVEQTRKAENARLTQSHIAPTVDTEQ